jgi:hypothetical protein
MTPEYRTPEEQEQQAEHEARVRGVLDQAVHNGASLMAAMAYGSPPEVVEHWVDALWDGLRDGLTDTRTPPGELTMEDRLTAIVLLLEDRIEAERVRIMAPAPDTSEGNP